MQNYKITISYEGTRYNGWQIQRDKSVTIQGKISEVLTKLAGEKIEVIGSGRTDSGVHAKQQTASFRLKEGFKEAEILKYLNKYLPEDIAVNTIEKAEENFHARFSCKSKTYRYRIHTSEIPEVFERKYVYNYSEKKLDVNLMRKASEILIGKHDFKAFCGNPHFKKSSVREIFSISIQETENEIVIDYTGDGFLQNMVRILTGTLIEVGNLNISLSDIKKILESKNRQNAGFTAPAQGLMLLKTEYM
ncbi:MAG: tRNA pseudouridine(38-40) synthase TruA [Bacteroidales bacterium]|nr:tRNA pseudouridine(38-40) synthase TruA [Bacteroidales bacterium]